jgi:hypothetical protein
MTTQTATPQKEKTLNLRALLEECCRISLDRRRGPVACEPRGRKAVACADSACDGGDEEESAAGW